MRTLTWLAVVGILTVSVMCACVPGPVPASVKPPFVSNPFEESGANPSGIVILHACDKQGICCYWETHSHGISCVATKIIVQISPGELKDEGAKPEAGAGFPNSHDIDGVGTYAPFDREDYYAHLR